MIPLFERYPSLQEKLPYVTLADLPTPVQKLDRLGAEIGVEQLYIKRDDLTGKVYGGNKVRKLEFLLGDALDKNAREVMTFGFAGSNHALATAVYAQQVGLKSISMLMPQHNAAYVRSNLLMSFASGAELHHYPNYNLLRIGTKYQILRHRIKNGEKPRIIPPGGSSTLGTVGFINAALELREQIDRGLMPEPDCIYAAMGTTGTVAGLMIGLKIASLKARVIPVRVVDYKFISEKRLAEHYLETAAFLKSLDSSFQNIELSDRDAEVECGFLGDGYACFTEAGMAAVKCAAESEGIKLDGTYTGKTLAALLRDAEKGRLRDRVVLFWDTLNSRDFPETAASIDYHRLPRQFFRYFEEDVQPLDI